MRIKVLFKPGKIKPSGRIGNALWNGRVTFVTVVLPDSY